MRLFGETVWFQKHDIPNVLKNSAEKVSCTNAATLNFIALQIQCTVHAYLHFTHFLPFESCLRSMPSTCQCLLIYYNNNTLHYTYIVGSRYTYLHGFLCLTSFQLNRFYCHIYSCHVVSSPRLKNSTNKYSLT
jgi:hypothetical protein